MGVHRQAGRAPAPRSRRLVGDRARLALHPLDTLLDAWRECGDVVRFRTAPARVYLLAHPDHVRHVLGDRDGRYVRARSHAAALHAASGAGLTGSEGALWREQRRALSPAFRREHAAAFEAGCRRATDRMLERWASSSRRGAAIDVREEMLQVALEALADGLFGAPLEHASGAAVRDAAVVLDCLYAAMRNPLPGSGVALRWSPRAAGARRRLYALAERLLQARRHADRGPDLLSLLLRAPAPPAHPRLAADQVVTMILAGHDTTGAALTWACHLVAAHPSVERRLQAESDLLAGSSPGPASYATMAFRETLRLRPPAWVLSRTPIADDVVDGCVVPRGATVLISPFVTHRHPDAWPDAGRFDPERFAAEPPPRHAYLPFGAGARMCIGRVLAETIGAGVLSAIARGHRLVPERPGPLAPAARLTLHPVGPVRMRVCERGA